MDDGFLIRETYIKKIIQTMFSKKYFLNHELNINALYSEI